MSTDVTGTWGFQPRRGERKDDLTVLWRRVLFNAENAPACPCHGIIAGRLDPDAIETNILAPLRTSYRACGQSELSELIERRMRKSPFAGLRQPFDKWLQALPEAPLPAGLREQLINDLHAALSYHADAPPEFVCV